MNYSTEVKFSNNLIKKGKTTISYTGTLYRTASEAVTIVYGFGDDWQHTTEKEMTKNEDCFSVEIELLDYDKINFCFRNSDYIWDNNNYLNYTAPLSEPEKEYNFIINENIIGNMLDNLFEDDLSAPTSLDNTTEFTNQVENSGAQESSLLEDSFEIEIPEDVPTDIENFIVTTEDEPSLSAVLEEAFSVQDESQDLKKEEIINFDIDALIDDILAPVFKASAEEKQKFTPNMNLNEIEVENTSEYDNTKSENLDQVSEDSLLEDVNSETSLIEVPDAEPNFLVSPRSLSKFYMLRKKIKLALYKFFTAIPKIIEANFNEEKNQ